MKKSLLLHLFLLSLVLPLGAQSSFQKSLAVYLDTAIIRSAPDGQSTYIVGMNNANNINRIYIMRFDGLGNQLWQREYIRSDRVIKGVSIETVSDGVLILLSDNLGTTRSTGYLMKLNTDGNYAWCYQLGVTDFTRVGEIKKDGAENIWLSAEQLPQSSTDSAYSYLIQFDRNGLILFGRKNLHHYFPNNLDEVYKVTDLIWNPLISSLLMVEDFEVPYNYSHIVQPNRGRFSIGFCNSNRVSKEFFMDIHIASLAMAKNHIAGSGLAPLVAIFNRTRETPSIFLCDPTGKSYIHIKTTKTIHRAIHSQNGDIVFYEPSEKILTKYDTTLTPLWTKKFDNCSITKAFAADVASDGSIYTIRNINQKTIISRILPTGSLSVCADYTKTPVPIVDFPNPVIPNSLPVTGFYAHPFQTNETLLRFNLTYPQTQDYCFKLDAAFDVPDTICLGTSLKPTNVDTTADLRHAWLIQSQWQEKVQPTIDFTSVGRYRIFHSVENDICSDTTSRYVTVVLPPKILIGDTIVCGRSKINIDITDKNTSRYFLNGTLTAPLFELNQNGNYVLRLENKGCKTEKNIKVKIVDFASPLKPVDSIYCQGIPVPVALTGRFENIYWDNKLVKDTFVITDAAKHSYRATYSLDKDCIVNGTFSVLRKNCGSAIPDIVFVPNAFSPNGDGTNDFFQAYPTHDADILSLMIYNRWGSLVFQSTDGIKTWDGLFNGKALQPDVYVYWIQYLDKRTNKVQIINGDITLIK